jgi:hypothetical protein
MPATPGRKIPTSSRLTEEFSQAVTQGSALIVMNQRVTVFDNRKHYILPPVKPHSNTFSTETP